MGVLEVIETRRSIRTYKSTPVDEKTLEKVLDAARLAPSWANSQTWRFIVVRDNHIKAQLTDTALRAGNRGIESLKEAPLAIVACAELNRAGCRDGRPITNKAGYWYMFDVGLALENMVLAAESFGLGTVLLGGFDADKAASILEVPDGYTVVAMTPLGYPDEQPQAKPRKELSEIVFRDRFNSH